MKKKKQNISFTSYELTLSKYKYIVDSKGIMHSSPDGGSRIAMHTSLPLTEEMFDMACKNMKQELIAHGKIISLDEAIKQMKDDSKPKPWILYDRISGKTFEFDYGSQHLDKVTQLKNKYHRKGIDTYYDWNDNCLKIKE